MADWLDLTKASATGYKAGTTTVATYNGTTATNTIDGNSANYYGAGTYTIDLTVTLPNPATISQYRITGATNYADIYAPYAWTLQGSADGGVTWTTIDSHTATSPLLTKGQVLTIPLAGPTPSYSRFRFQNLTTQKSANWLYMGDVGFYGDTLAGTDGWGTVPI